MKEKFNKYWAEVHLLMAIAAVLDPRVKKWSLTFCFPKIYNPADCKTLVEMVEKTLKSLHTEYVAIYNESANHSSEKNGSFMLEALKAESKTLMGYGFEEVQNFVRQNEAAPMQKTDLDAYIEDGCHMCAPEENKHFNILDWWKSNESNAGSRLIDQYRASLGVETVQALLWGGNWIRNVHGVKKKIHVLKRRNRTLVEAARTMLIFSKSPLFLWAEAVATACYTQNRSLNHTRYNKTPYELLKDRKPELKYLHIFGALYYPTNDFEDLGKLQPKADIGIFISYSPS
ncbi:retrovirus-related pol polyprotein from transposon TNT 1-94 [Tanacetum coccineum]